MTGIIAQPQELVGSGREDTQKDNDGIETGDEFEEITPDISQWRDSDTLTPGEQKKRASKHLMTKEPPVTDGDPTLPNPL